MLDVIITHCRGCSYARIRDRRTHRHTQLTTSGGLHTG
jgi:hypothetical protein